MYTILQHMSLILSRPRHYYKVNSSWSKWRGNKQVSRCDSSSPWLFGFRVCSCCCFYPNEGIHKVIRVLVHALTSLLGSMSLIVCSTLKSDKKQQYLFWTMHPTTQLGALCKRELKYPSFAQLCIVEVFSPSSVTYCSNYFRIRIYEDNNNGNYPLAAFVHQHQA